MQNVRVISYWWLKSLKFEPNLTSREDIELGYRTVYLRSKEELDKAGVDILFIDTAHGHSSAVLESFKKIRKKP